jgi:hypothetical protein
MVELVQLPCKSEWPSFVRSASTAGEFGALFGDCARAAAESASADNNTN